MFSKIIFLLVIATSITGCSSSFRLLNDNDEPVKGAIVVSEIPNYIMQKWTVQIDVSDLNGEADTLIGRIAVYKKGFHPIVTGSDVSGVFNYSDRPFKTIILKNDVRMYPIKSSKIHTYPMLTKWIDIEESVKKEKRINKNINIDIDHCHEVSATYSSKSKLLTIKSSERNLLGSDRFFYESASDSNIVNTLSSRERIFFYCINHDKSIYKTGISINLRGGMRVRGTEKLISRYSMIMMKSKVNTINAYIEPRIQPTRPLQYRYMSHNRGYPKIVLKKSKKEILRAIEVNIPNRNKEEKELKKMLLMIIK